MIIHARIPFCESLQANDPYMILSHRFCWKRKLLILSHVHSEHPPIQKDLYKRKKIEHIFYTFIQLSSKLIFQFSHFISTHYMLITLQHILLLVSNKTSLYSSSFFISELTWDNHIIFWVTRFPITILFTTQWGNSTHFQRKFK